MLGIIVSFYFASYSYIRNQEGNYLRTIPNDESEIRNRKVFPLVKVKTQTQQKL